MGLGELWCYGRDDLYGPILFVNWVSRYLRAGTSSLRTHLPGTISSYALDFVHGFHFNNLRTVSFLGFRIQAQL